MNPMSEQLVAQLLTVQWSHWSGGHRPVLDIDHAKVLMHINMAMVFSGN